MSHQKFLTLSRDWRCDDYGQRIHTHTYNCAYCSCKLHKKITRPVKSCVIFLWHYLDTTVWGLAFFVFLVYITFGDLSMVIFWFLWNIENYILIFMVICHIIYLSIFFDRARSLYGDFTGGLERCIFFNPISSPHVAASSKFFGLHLTLPRFFICRICFYIYPSLWKERMIRQTGPESVLV